jgi:hypothetical protein
MSSATSSSWKTLAPPERKEQLQFEAFFNDEEAAQMMEGLIPGSMEDKWFVYFSDGWLNFHRSWTGALIYSLRLDGSPAGVRVVDSWVNREPEQYKATDIEYDRKLLHFLIDALLLKKNAVFPMPASTEAAASGVVQHSYVGRAYPEAPASSADPAPSRLSRPWWKVW